MIEFACYQCGRTIHAKDEIAGRRVKCPKCASVLRVPEASTHESADATPPPKPTRRAKDAAICPSCNHQLKPNAVLCVNCGHDLRSGQQVSSASPAAPATGSPRAGAASTDTSTETSAPIIAGAMAVVLLLPIAIGGILWWALSATGASSGGPGMLAGFGLGGPDARRLVVHLPGLIHGERKVGERSFGDHFGGFAALGDVTGDGYTDFAVATKLDSPDAGVVTAYAGQTGEQLWRVEGNSSDESIGQRVFWMRGMRDLGDINGDNIADLYLREDWHERQFKILSGRDGSEILHYLPPDLPESLRGPTRQLSEANRSARQAFNRRVRQAAFTPFHVADVTGDHAPELLRAASITDTQRGIHQLEMRIYGMQNNALLEERTVLTVSDSSYPGWLLSRFPDADGDGVDDYLARVDDQCLVISSADLTTVDRIPAVRRADSVAAPGDLNGDGRADVVVARSIGAGKDDDFSYVAAFAAPAESDAEVSLAATELWRRVGNEFDMGAETIMINSQGGQVSTKPVRDVEFGNLIQVIEDLDGDTVADLATLVETGAYHRSHAVLLLSGATGRTIDILRLPESTGILTGEQMIVLDSVDEDNGAGLLLDARDRQGDYKAVVLALPQPGS